MLHIGIFVLHYYLTYSLAYHLFLTSYIVFKRCHLLYLGRRFISFKAFLH